MVFFFQKWKADLKIYTELQETLNGQNNFEKEQTSEGLTLSNFKTHYKATVIKTG